MIITKKQIKKQLKDLLKETKSLSREVNKTNRKTRGKVENINREIDKRIKEVEKTCFHLDEIEKKTGEEIDGLMLRQSKDLIKE